MNKLHPTQQKQLLYAGYCLEIYFNFLNVGTMPLYSQFIFNINNIKPSDRLKYKHCHVRGRGTACVAGWRGWGNHEL